MPVRAIIFDFDGVLVESNRIKDEAFHDLYLDYGPNAARSAFEIHVRNHGASRYEKFALIHREVLGREISGPESLEMGERFSQMCFERICVCPEVPGAMEFLQKQRPGCFLAIVSATPSEELRRIVDARVMSSFFRYCLGKPVSKEENLGRILAEESLRSDEAVFVGDQISDYEAALSVGIPFIARVSDPVRNPFAGIPGAFPRLSSLHQLENCLVSQGMLA